MKGSQPAAQTHCKPIKMSQMIVTPTKTISGQYRNFIETGGLKAMKGVCGDVDKS